jgi:hypothetical protein
MKLALIIFAAASSGGPQQFDLSCVGARTIGGAAGQPVSINLRVDLPSAQYCADACSSVQHVQDILADRIVLYDQPVIGEVIRGTRTQWLDRVTGEYREKIELTAPHATIDTRMQCTLQPFTGFPNTRF